MTLKNITKILFIILVFLPNVSLARSEDVGQIFKGQVLEIISQESREDFFTEEVTEIQILKVRNTKTGEEVIVHNDYRVVSLGQKIFYSVNDFGGGEYQNYLVGKSRLWQIISLTIFFIIIVVIFSGKKGVRSLVSLLLSFLAIFFILIPLILKGVNPLIVGPFLAFLILFFAIFFSYGWNTVSKVAFVGTSITVVITSLLAFFSIKFFALTGFADDTSIYLSFLSDTPINLVNLLTTGIIIGVLGVLDDIAVTQVAVVRELYLSNSSITKKEVYKSAIRVGQDHVSALVNTLVLAYTGVALPIILVFKLSNGTFESIISQEIFAGEIVRTIVGSIGVVLAVPITTWLAVKVLGEKRDKLSSIDFEGGHHHGHDHH